jgi:hypothetical protein
MVGRAGGTGWVLMLSMLLLDSGVQKDASMSMQAALGLALMEMLMVIMMEASLLLRIDRIVGKVFGGE